jgi:hypothetical protein
VIEIVSRFSATLDNGRGLSEAKIVPPDTVLDALSLAAVKMPNRDGFIHDSRPEKFPPVAKTQHQSMMIAPLPN